ncbi:hypothetical protein C0J52_20160 [Blattella germanica]|nr:hypothetical protein C0J52_20160 [Blattella germanica]
MFVTALYTGRSEQDLFRQPESSDSHGVSTFQNPSSTSANPLADFKPVGAIVSSSSSASSQTHSNYDGFSIIGPIPSSGSSGNIYEPSVVSQESSGISSSSEGHGYTQPLIGPAGSMASPSSHVISGALYSSPLSSQAASNVGDSSTSSIGVHRPIQSSLLSPGVITGVTYGLPTRNEATGDTGALQSIHASGFIEPVLSLPVSSSTASSESAAIAGGLYAPGIITSSEASSSSSASSFSEPTIYPVASSSAASQEISGGLYAPPVLVQASRGSSASAVNTDGLYAPVVPFMDSSTSSNVESPEFFSPSIASSPSSANTGNIAGSFIPVVPAIYNQPATVPGSSDSSRSSRTTSMAGLQNLGNLFSPDVVVQMGGLSGITEHDSTRFLSSTGNRNDAGKRITDVASALHRRVPSLSERGPPPGAQFVPIPVVPLPSGAMRHRNRFRPAQPPPTPPSTTPLPTSPQPIPLIEVTERPIAALPIQPLANSRPLVLLTSSSTTTSKPEEPNVPIVFSENYQSDDGSYLFDFEAANSVAQREQGFIKHESGLDVLVKKGYYSFIGPDGLLYRIDYLADENGFQATGEHLPNGRFPAFLPTPKGTTQKSVVTYPPANY